MRNDSIAKWANWGTSSRLAYRLPQKKYSRTNIYLHLNARNRKCIFLQDRHEGTPAKSHHRFPGRETEMLESTAAGATELANNVVTGNFGVVGRRQAWTPFVTNGDTSARKSPHFVQLLTRHWQERFDIRLKKAYIFHSNIQCFFVN